MSRARLVSLLFVTLAACGGSKKPTSTTTTDPVTTGSGSGTASGTDTGSATPTTGDMPADFTAEVDKAISLVDQLATAAESGKGDCAKMATAMKAVADGADGGAIKAVDADKRYNDYKDQVETKYGDQTDKLSERLQTALGSCAKGDPNAQKIGDVLVQVGLAGGGDTDGDGDQPDGDEPHGGK